MQSAQSIARCQSRTDSINCKDGWGQKLARMIRPTCAQDCNWVLLQASFGRPIVGRKCRKAACTPALVTSPCWKGAALLLMCACTRCIHCSNTQSNECEGSEAAYGVDALPTFCRQAHAILQFTFCAASTPIQQPANSEPPVMQHKSLQTCGLLGLLQQVS